MPNNAQLQPWRIAYLLHDKFSSLAKNPYFLYGYEDLQGLLSQVALAKKGDETFIFISLPTKRVALYIQHLSDGTINAFINHPVPEEVTALLNKKFGTSLKITAIEFPAQNENIANVDDLLAIEMLLACAKKTGISSQILQETLAKQFQSPAAINKALAQYQRQSKDIAIDIQSQDDFKNLVEWQGLREESFLPTISPSPIYALKLVAPNKLLLTMEQPLKLYLDDAIFGADVEIAIDKQHKTVTFSAKDAATLRKVFDDLTKPDVQWRLFQQNRYQQLALTLLGHEAKEVIDLAQIQQNNTKGGLTLDIVNLALKHFLSERQDIYVLTEHYSLDDQKKQLPELIADAEISGCRYVVFSYAINPVHQVLVIIDHKDKMITQINSENNNDVSSIKNLLQRDFPSYQIKTAAPLMIQKDQYSCGMHVVLNAQYFFKQPLLCDPDPARNLTDGIRQVLRAGKYEEDIVVFKQKIQKINEAKLIDILLPMLEKAKPVETLYKELTKSHTQKHFSFQNFIDSFGKTNRFYFQLLQSIYALTLLPHVIQDEGKLKTAIAKLLENTLSFQPMTSGEQGKQEKAMTEIIGTEIKFAEQDAISKHDQHLKLEQMLEAYLLEGTRPEYLEDYFSRYAKRPPDANIYFYLCHLLSERLIQFEQQQINANRSLSVALERKKQQEAKLAEAVEQYASEIINKLGPEAEKFRDRLKAQKKIRIFTVDKWVALLKDFPEDSREPSSERFKFIERNRKKILNASQLKAMIEFVSMDHVPFDFISAAHLIEDKVKNSYELWDILQLVETDNRLDVVQSCVDVIQSVDDLLLIAGLLPNSVRTMFIKNYKHIWVSELPYIIQNFIPEHERLDFAQSYANQINNIEDLVMIARELPVSARLTFVRNNKDKIRDWEEKIFITFFLLGHKAGVYSSRLSKLLLEIATPSGNKFTRFFEDRARVYELMLSDNFLSVLITQKHTIKDISDVKDLTTLLLIPEQLQLLKALKNDIPAKFSLVDIVRLAQENDRLELVQYFQDKIKHGYQLAEVGELLPQNKRLSFIETQVNKIKTGYQLAKVAVLLFEDERVDFIKKQIDKIKNCDELCAVLEVISEAQRFDIAVLLINKIETKHDLLLVGKMLPRDAQGLLVNMFSQKESMANASVSQRGFFSSKEQTKETSAEATEKLQQSASVNKTQTK